MILANSLLYSLIIDQPMEPRQKTGKQDTHLKQEQERATFRHFKVNSEIFNRENFIFANNVKDIFAMLKIRN